MLLSIRTEPLHFQFEDSQRAAELDKRYFKGFLRNGEAAVELGKGPVHQDTKLIDQGIEQLQRALYLCWNMDEGDKNYYHKDSYAKEIGKQIYRAKKIRWFKQKDLEKAERSMILDQLENELELNQPNQIADEAPRGGEVDQKDTGDRRVGDP